MQLHTFTTGGFVCHKIHGMRLSAWYDAAGKVLDVEAFALNGKARRVSQRDRDIAAHVGAVEAARLASARGEG